MVEQQLKAPKYSCSEVTLHTNANMSDKEEMLKRKELENVVLKGNLNDVRDYIKINNIDASAILGGSSSELRSAVEKGHLDIVRFLIGECRSDVNYCEGYYPFIHAIEANQNEIAQYFIHECHANVDLPARDDHTALHMYSQKGSLHRVKYLVEECRANVNAINEFGQAPIHCAVREGHLDIVQYLAEHGHADLEVEDNVGCTPLHDSISSGRFAICQYLIKEWHVNVEAIGGYNETALHQAVRYTQLNEVRYLIQECKVSMEAKDSYGDTALHYSVRQNYDECEHFRRIHPSLDVIECLTQQSSINMNAQNNVGRTAFHVACYFGYIDVVRYFVEKCDMNLEAKCHIGRTPLHYAIDITGDGQWGALRRLECYCDNTDTRTFDVVRYLVQDALVDVEAKDNRGDTALILACETGNLNVIRLLIQECYANGSVLL